MTSLKKPLPRYLCKLPNLRAFVSRSSLTFDLPPRPQNNELTIAYLPESYQKPEPISDPMLLDPVSEELTLIRRTCCASPVSLSESCSNFKPTHGHLRNSSRESRPVSKSSFCNPISSLITPTRLFLNANSVYLNHGRLSTHLSNTSKQPRTIFKTRFCHQNPYKLTQRRSFSIENSDQNPKPSPSIAIPVTSTVSAPCDTSVPIDAGSSIRKPISLWPGMYHSPVTNALWEARSSMFEKLGDKPGDEVSQNELVAKTPSGSRTSILYKFSSDYILREQYRNPWNEIRMGKLLEDLDALAGTISFKHCCSDDGRTRPILLVTASVDRMVLKKPIQIDTDLEIVGAVTWVGRSSMEIQLQVIQSTEAAANESESLALVANFTFVARDSRTGKSTPINQILPETDDEKLLWKEAEERNKMRKQKKIEHKGDTGIEDADRLNALLYEGRIFCDMPALADRDSILIKDTRHENSLICQPQQRNIHGRIFGGFLMRRAFELAFSNAYAFAGAAPCFREVDHVDFYKPVDVGNFLRLKSCVLYTELDNPDEPLIDVEVIAHVTRPEIRCSEVSNKFYFTFTVRPEAMREGPRIRNVVPATEEEARRVLERMDAEKSQSAKS